MQKIKMSKFGENGSFGRKGREQGDQIGRFFTNWATFGGLL